MRVWIGLVFAIGAAAAAETWIDQYTQESAATNRACAAKDNAGCRDHLVRLVELLDGRADVVYRLAKAEALVGNTSAAVNGLVRFSKMGLPFADPDADPAFAPIRLDAEFPGIVARLKAAGKPVTSSRPFAVLPEKDLVAEDIAYDRGGDRFLVSSVRQGEILSIRRDGTAGVFLAKGQPDIWAVLALGVDDQRKYVWATTVAMPEWSGYQAADKGRSALLRFSLSSGALLKRYDLPRGTDHALGDLTLSPAGDVFVSDGYGEVYWIDHARDTLEVLVPKGTFRSPQTPALGAGGKTLFVPDYSRGIGIVNLVRGEARLLAHPPDLSLGGIDGLYLAGRTMIAVQNGTAPPRLIRMRLDAGLTRVESWEVLESNGKELGAPTHGVVVGREFYFIANSGWDRLADDGSVKPGVSFEAPTIRMLPVETRGR